MKIRLNEWYPDDYFLCWPQMYNDMPVLSRYVFLFSFFLSRVFPHFLRSSNSQMSPVSNWNSQDLVTWKSRYRSGSLDSKCLSINTRAPIGDTERVTKIRSNGWYRRLFSALAADVWRHPRPFKVCFSFFFPLKFSSYCRSSLFSQMPPASNCTFSRSGHPKFSFTVIPQIYNDDISVLSRYVFLSSFFLSSFSPSFFFSDGDYTFQDPVTPVSHRLYWNPWLVTFLKCIIPYV